MLADFTGSDLATLRELDAENFTLDLVASYNHLIPPEDAHMLLSLSLSLSAKAFGVEKPIVVNDYPALETKNQQAYVDSGVKSALILPVRVDGEILGTLGFASRFVNHYQEDTVRVLTAISAAVGMMLAKAELHQDYEVEANIGRIVSSSLEAPEIFEKFAAEASKLVEFERLALNSINTQENTYIVEFLFGGEVRNFPVGKVLEFNGTALDTVVRSRDSQRLLLDERDGMEPNFPNAGLLVATGQRYFLGVPLIVGDQVIGTFGFIRGSRPFSHKDVTKAERLGNLVAGAFADFKLQEFKFQAEQELQKNREILEAEADIGRILSGPMHEIGAFETIKFEIAKVISLDRIVISAIDVETETFSGDSNLLLNESTLMYPENQGQPYEGTLTAEVVRLGTGQIIHADDPRLESGQLPRVVDTFRRGYWSLMVVPLRFEAKFIGSLSILSESKVESDEEDLVNADRIGKLLAGALVTFKITAERNRAQLALSESDSRFRQIADSIEGVFWLRDLYPGRLVYASPSFEKLWDIPIAGVYRDFNRWFETIHPEDRARVKRASAAAAETGELDMEYRIIRLDGSVRWIHTRGFPILDENGKLFRMSGIGEDVTNRKLELERITEAGRLLSIGELASGVAHEINNPLANINLYAEALLEQDFPDSVIEDLQVILDQGKRASVVVRNLLQFARKSSPDISTVDAREFVERCLELKRHEFRVNNISVSVSVLLGCAEIKIDENLMTQVVVNILTNAEQACVAANGRGRISVTVREIDGSTEICISDDGPGISPQYLAKVFDPFFTTKEVGEGTGSGLSVSYGIMAQLGGNLRVKSDGLTGSTFHIELPRVEAEESSTAANNEASSGNGLAPNLHVLVVDDEPDLRFILARLVERQGHTADQAGDGEEAWRNLQDRNYDCVLTRPANGRHRWPKILPANQRVGPGLGRQCHFCHPGCQGRREGVPLRRRNRVPPAR